jgi:Thioredoxin like C-terminal domain/AhpC/TSA family
LEEEMAEATSRGAAAELPIEGELQDLGGANAWLNSEPLTPAGLRGKVVLVQFCTYSCVNWLRTLPYVRAWDERYRDDGLVVIGAHSPEFPFEHDVEKVGPALEAMGVTYPIAIDNDFAVWRAFGNQYWPALYVADAEGRLRDHHFGEGRYEGTERVIQQLLAEAGSAAVDHEPVSVDPHGLEVSADFETLGSPETYVGYARAENLVVSDGVLPDGPREYGDPPALGLNQWSLSGNWTVGRQATVMSEPGGRITFRFHARDLNLVLGPSESGDPVGFRALIDGTAPGPAQGVDVDDEGNGTVTEARCYQLIRQPGSVSDRTFEITFLDAGVQAYVFTFG